MTRNARQTLAFALFGTGLLAVSPLSLAHTGIKDPGTAGSGLYTAATIGHGCGIGTKGTKQVTAQSLVFPWGISDGSDGNLVATVGTTPADLTDFLDTTDPKLFSLSPGMVQDKNVFQAQVEVTDANANVVAINFTKGNLDTTAVGVIPFRVSLPDLADGQTNSDGSVEAESCIKTLKVRIGIANWCSKTQDESQDFRADIWIGHLTTKFDDPGVMPNDFATSPFWPTLTVNRATELPASCGAGIDVNVEPSDAFIDQYLPIKGYWPQP
ncbi:MAG: hypothetical protein U1E83_10635 [Methylotetracoccus sp.]